jgi:hypothetical protein
MSESHMPDIPTLTIGMSLFLAIGWMFQPSRDVLFLMAFILLAVVTEVTYRRMDDRSDSHR